MGKADRKSQTLREKGAESGGSLEKKMAELLKDSPLVRSAFLLSGTAGCASPAGVRSGSCRRCPYGASRGLRYLLWSAVPVFFYSWSLD